MVPCFFRLFIPLPSALKCSHLCIAAKTSTCMFTGGCCSWSCSSYWCCCCCWSCSFVVVMVQWWSSSFFSGYALP